MSTIKQVKLGSQGLAVPTIGLGCMGMTFGFGSNIYGIADEKEALATLHRSLELGGNFIDTADIYGPGLNEQLISKGIEGKRDQFVIATKFGFEIDDHNQATGKINGKKDYIKKSIERSLKNLKTDYVDLYYMHRMDQHTPIEETMETLAELVKEGKIKYIGLSEAGSETIKRAHAVQPVTAVQSEYSLFERQVEELGILDTLKELGIGFVPYSPLGRGFISGDFQKPEDFPENDFRRVLPKFQGEQFNKNLDLLHEIGKIADEKSVTKSQLALAWIIQKGFVPIPGTKKVKYVEQNIAAAGIELSQEEVNRLEAIIPLGTITGDRYDEAGMRGINI